MDHFRFLKELLIRGFVLLIAIVSTGFLSAQTVTLSGKVTDAFSGESLIGANVVYAPGKGVVSDIDGNFKMELPAGTYDLHISYVGYTEITKQVVLQSKAIHLSIQMESIELDEVMVVADIARERSTPIAFSSISQKQIIEEQGAGDLPMLLNYTPGVYATQQGGGDGDARINIRGFDQSNMAVMVDGIPVNDMENGWVYWSNWRLPTKQMQVQRGLSASKLALPSVGGTINVITIGIDSKPSVNFKQDFGSGNYTQSSLQLNTGRLKGDWGVVFSGSYREGNGIVDATFTKGFSYYLKVEKFLGNHRLSLSGMGAPQRHGQRSYKQEISLYDRDLAKKAGVPDSIINQIPEMGIQYNSHWGTYENSEIYGQGVNNNPLDPDKLEFESIVVASAGTVIKQIERTNYYHKPMFSLRDFWSISDKTVWVNTFYASFGNGGGTGLNSSIGLDENLQLRFQDVYVGNRINTIDQGFDDTFRTIDTTYSYTEYKGSNFLRSSVNNHNWYGFLSQVTHKFNKKLTFSGGIDLRSYKGIHYREIYDMIGADYIIDNSDLNASPNVVKREGDKIRYYDEGLVRWGGFFTQLEYTNGIFSVVGNLTGSMSQYNGVDYFRLREDASKPYETGWQSFYGFTAKLGANYNINEMMNVFINTGHLNNAPRFNSVIDINNNVISNPENEMVNAFELGYALSTRKLSLTVNGYYTNWKNKPINRSTSVPFPSGGHVSDSPPDGDRTALLVRSLDALHAGIEFDAAYVFHPKWKVQALFSIGDWTWQSVENAEYIYKGEEQVLDADGNPMSVEIDAVGVHVGDAAQFQLGGMLEFRPSKVSYVRARFTHFGKNYSNFNPGSIIGENSGRESWQIPNYQLLDLFAGYTFIFDNYNLVFGIVVNNILDTVYISDAQNNETRSLFINSTNFDAASAGIFPGLPRRYTFTITLVL